MNGCGLVWITLARDSCVLTLTTSAERETGSAERPLTIGRSYTQAVGKGMDNGQMTLFRVAAVPALWIAEGWARAVGDPGVAAQPGCARRGLWMQPAGVAQAGADAVRLRAASTRTCKRS